MGIYEHRCCALASRLLVDLAARHPRRRDVRARPGKDRRRTRGTRARKMDTGKWGGRTPVSRGARDRGPEMRALRCRWPSRTYAAPRYRPSVRARRVYRAIGTTGRANVGLQLEKERRSIQSAPAASQPAGAGRPFRRRPVPTALVSSGHLKCSSESACTSSQNGCR